MDNKAQTLARNIKLLLLDVDGVLTNGKLYFDSNGGESKAFNTLDGHGIKMLQKSGVNVGIITGRTSALVARRAQDLGISPLIQGREDKWQALTEQLDSLNIKPEHIAYMGDDWPDLSVMMRVGFALSVPNGHASVIERAHWVSPRKGGEGAVRDACDFIMQAQSNFTDALNHYLPEE